MRLTASRVEELNVFVFVFCMTVGTLELVLNVPILSPVFASLVYSLGILNLVCFIQGY
jgi:hypothetical protein